MDEHVEHRAFDGVGVHPLAHRQVALRIEVDDENALARLSEGYAEVQRRRRLRDATLLVRERDDVRGHGTLAERSRCGLGGRNGVKTRYRLLDHGRRWVGRGFRSRLGSR